jgi:hypothetical protein
MDENRFDILTKSLLDLGRSRRTLSSVPSRRDVLRGLAASGIGLGMAQLPVHVRAENQYGCLNVGDRCKKASQCCSGVCKRKGGKRKCAAHDAGKCSLLRNRCTATDPILAACNLPDEWATCLVTIGNAPFCGTLLAFKQDVHCQTCTKDADCLSLGFPPGSACVQLGGQFCNGCEATDNRACLPPAVQG